MFKLAFVSCTRRMLGMRSAAEVDKCDRFKALNLLRNGHLSHVHGEFQGYIANKVEKKFVEGKSFLVPAEMTGSKLLRNILRCACAARRTV